MDYDKTEIAKTYNQARSHGPNYLRLWMDVVAAHLDIARIRTVLDLGCGTGRFSEALASRLNANVIAVDPSIKMLSEATKNSPCVSRVCASAEGIPLETNSVDLIFISMAFHHFTDPSTAAQECRRVLSPHGRVFLRTPCRERVDAYAYVPYFPSSKELIEERLPSLEFQCEVFKTASFRVLHASVITQEIASDYAAYAEKLALRADSILVTLDDNEFNSGVAAVRSEKTPGPVVEPIDIVVFEKGS